MRILPALVAVAALVAGFQLLRDVGDQGSVGSVDEAPSSGNYRLAANGDEAACAVRRGVEISKGLSKLMVASDCRLVFPGMERAKFWRERDDGTVAFSTNGVDPIVTFGVADGEGYESYAPAMPLLSLAATGE
ncbi:hypothetical protein LGH82_16290 [Mesorhizobium sp. PAMC28654]|uniref:hypothetical protein n=1 Tax=Mesorhizobium sp. PAMC28654 TaxID=2880934 RepID=UPI001D0BBE76|nr:hypothetical protein [Mesorhizobium sp. PAMC28654]UDL92645.1 hypothetical protein LGH82_16290 [Mesorhizobium sp. PAMC28654]